MIARWTMLAALLAVAGGCGEKPEEAYNRLIFNAKMGNEAAFLECFTKDSRPLVRTMIALRRTYPDFISDSADPYLSLVLEEVTDVEITERSDDVKKEDGSLEKVTRKVAMLTISDGQGTRRKVRMVRYDDGWKLDALDLQKLWLTPENFNQAE